VALAAWLADETRESADRGEWLRFCAIGSTNNSSPPRSLRYRKGSLLRKTPTPSLAGAFWRDYHFAHLRHTRYGTVRRAFSREGAFLALWLRSRCS
jgi:hypothetical protein